MDPAAELLLVESLPMEFQNTTSTVSSVIIYSSIGASIVFSFVAFYGNLVLSRSLFKSTLITCSHRRVVRFFCFLHVFVAFLLLFSSAMFIFHEAFSRVFPLFVCFFIIFRDFSRSAPAWLVLERIVYNSSQNVREEKSMALVHFIRASALVSSFVPPAVLLFSLRTETFNDAFSSRSIQYTLYVYGVASILLIIVLVLLILRTASSLRLSQGLVAVVRKKKLDSEKAAFVRMTLPLVIVFILFSAAELLFPFFIPPELLLSSSFLLYSIRAIFFPLSQVFLQSHIREDCWRNVFIWRKLERRSSEARVRTIMNKESQETIITNFKMIGILAE